MKKEDYIQLFNKFLQKQATPDEVRLLIDWLKKDSAFSDWADEEWSIVSSEMNPALQQKLFGQIKQKIELPMVEKRAKHRSLLAWSMRVAAVLLLVLASGIGIYWGLTGKKAAYDMVVAVEKGQKANVTLPDGSKVWVNSDSKLSYGNRFNAKERVLHLDGEAYFEVTPDKDRPFIVETNDISVRALGTSFDVKNYKEEDHISTVLMTGRVEITSDKDCVILEPNEKMTFNKQTGRMQKSSVEDAVGYADWKFNMLSFKSETFENIAHTLERYYNTQIVFESESLKEHRFTGALGNTSLESILQILSLTSPLSYEIKDSLIILRENIKEKSYYENALK